MPRYQLRNNVSTTSPGAITSAATSVTLASATGFPTSGSDFFATILDSTGAYEIVLMQAVAGVTRNITRAQASTSAQNFLAGAKVSMNLVTTILDNFVCNDGTGATGTSWAISITGNALTATTATTAASCSGNAATVTNGVYTSGSYADPAWITSLAGAKITGGVTNLAGGLIGYLPYQSALNATAFLAPGAAGTTLQSQGPSSAPAYILVNKSGLRDVNVQVNGTGGSPASGALITINPTAIDFRSATLGSGTVNTRSIGAAITLTIPSTATMGTVSGVKSKIAIIAMDNAGTVEVAAGNVLGGNSLDETGLISTTAISTSANSANVFYSTIARSNLPYRVVGFFESTQATAGTWITAPSTIQGMGGAQGGVPIKSLTTAKAWVNFDGTLTGTITPRSSFNISSVTKVSAGTYTVNLSTAMADTNYCVTYCGGDSSGNALGRVGNAGLSTTSFPILSVFVSGTPTDTTNQHIVVFGN